MPVKRKPKSTSDVASPPKRSAKLRKLATQIRRFAISFPGATEDYPWGERVVKINKKVFAFLGDPYQLNGKLTCTVKLRDSRAGALKLKQSSPCRYGLGKHGWVTIRISPGDPVPTLAKFEKWITESHNAVAERS